MKGPARFITTRWRGQGTVETARKIHPHQVFAKKTWPESQSRNRRREPRRTIRRWWPDGEDGGGTPEAKMAIPRSRRQSSSGGSISSRGRRDLPLVVEACRDLTKG